MYKEEQELMSARHYIIMAFLKLLQSTSFKEMTVKDIVTKAGISRSTFYLHFHDKYELMETVRRTIIHQFLSHYDRHEYVQTEATQSIKKTTDQICQHIFEYRHFYKYEFDNPLFIQNLSNGLALKLQQVYTDQSYSIFASFGTIGYLTHWVKNGFQLSPTEAANQLMNIGITDWSK